jgi:cyclophilin family peptidyl-prolyl cis-trans isomerase
MHDRNWTRARRAALQGAFALLAGLGLLVAPAAAHGAQPNPEVRVNTSMGSFVIELRPRRAPLTVQDFLHYVRSGFYTNTLFHRVVANFILQGGGHEATPPYALKPTGPPVVNESGNGLENRAGTVGLARGPNPDSGTAQFYVNLVDNPELDPLPTRWGYAVFGKVIQGMNVVERIGMVPTGAFGPFKSYAPLKPVVIKSIELITPPTPHAASATGPAPSTGKTAPQAGSAQQPAGAAGVASGATTKASAAKPEPPASGGMPPKS